MLTKMRPGWLTWLLGACLLPAALADWPEFRGPRGDGHAPGVGLPITWGGFLEPPVWQTNIPGRGWSSPIVWHDRIWVTSAEETALPEAANKRRLAENPYGSEEFQTHATVSLLALEIDLDTGHILRRLELFTVDNPTPIHAWNSYASPTPVTDGERLYCHFGSFGTVCVEMASGKVLWKQRLAVDDITGPGGSPVLYLNLLILACDGTDAQFVVALDKLTGATIWRTDRPVVNVPDSKHRRAFSTPLIIRHEGRTQLLAPAAQWLVSYNPIDGTEWWRARIGNGHALVPRPVFHDGIVFVCTGYLKPELWALRVDGTGDVSESHVVWRYARQVPEISSPAIVGDRIYFVSTLGVATCLRTDDGSQVWQHRIEGNYAASPLVADGKLYFTSQEGVTTVLEAGDTYRELAKNQLFGQTLASLAVAGKSVLIRTHPLLYCVRSDE
ncbi:MAG: PQQ-binding-like beta-propeller repeat protein [Pirellulaceae bacterium]